MSHWIDRHAGKVFGIIVVTMVVATILLVNPTGRRLDAASPAARTTYSYALVTLPTGLGVGSDVSAAQRALNMYGQQGYRQIHVVEPTFSIGAWGHGYIILERSR